MMYRGRKEASKLLRKEGMKERTKERRKDGRKEMTRVTFKYVLRRDKNNEEAE